MTTGGTRAAPATAAGPGAPQLTGSSRAGVRLVRLYATSRRVPAAVTAIAACALGLRIALTGHWDSYGALQLPLVFETAAACRHRRRPPQARSANRNASPGGGCHTCGWPPRWR